jgi:hypothetical protein
MLGLDISREFVTIWEALQVEEISKHQKSLPQKKQWETKSP